MEIKKDTLVAFGLGNAVFASMLVLAGAVERNTSNSLASRKCLNLNGLL